MWRVFSIVLVLYLGHKIYKKKACGQSFVLVQTGTPNDSI